MIRVLHVVTHMNRGGLETMIMNYYRNIDKKKIQFDFLVHRMERAAYDEEIETLGGYIHRLPVLNPFSLKYRKKLNNFFKEHPEYQIVHVHQDCLSSIILKAAKKNGVRVRIAHSHNANQDKNIKYFIKIFYMQFIPHYATALMACGQAAGDWMFQGKNYTILNNAINCEEYAFNAKKRKDLREQLNINKDELIIGHIGRFSSPKNHKFLVEVFAKVNESRSSKLLLIGDGELRGDIEKQVKELKLEDKVIFTGVRSDIPDLLQAMDIFVFPSVYEGLPVTMIEAQASGIQCVISDAISDKCIITKNVVSIEKLSDSKEKWAELILKKAKIQRRDTTDEIKTHGYDIKENAKWLEEFYLRSYN